MSFFFKNKGRKVIGPKTDIHSHLIPGLDDGVQSLSESLELLDGLQQQGYEKVITTPHVMGDFYPNTPEMIRSGLIQVQEALKASGLDIKLEAAAEYYLDEFFVESLNKREELLTFGEKYLLFETAFMNEPVHLKEAIFKMKSLGYQPVYAHPERYQYLHRDFSLVEDIVDRGALLQVNINSLTGYYSRPVQKMAEKLIDRNLVHFLGSDCHNQKHLNTTIAAFSKKYFARAMNLQLLNDTLN